MENREMVMEEMEAANGGHMLLDLFSIMQKIVVGEVKPTTDRDFFKSPRYFSVSVWLSRPRDSSKVEMISLLVLT